MLLRVTIYCFLASYSLALVLELLYLRISRPVVRILALLAGLAGLIAHTLYLSSRHLPPPDPGTQFSWLLFVVCWVLAVFYLYGAVHHRRQSWGLFVLPPLIGMVVLGWLFDPGSSFDDYQQPQAASSWWPVHVILILLAAVGVCVGFIASVMYLIQAHRLRTKHLPGQGLKLFSLERIESMNRRAIILAFPLLTAGILAGVLLMVDSSQVSLTDLRVLGTLLLWASFAVLLYLRYGRHVRGRQVALMTIVAFLLLLCCLALSHSLPQGGVNP
jgi:ABC-type uncharacterized transport system permease subunit